MILYLYNCNIKMEYFLNYIAVFVTVLYWMVSRYVDYINIILNI